MLPAIGAGDAVTGATTSADVDQGKPEPDLLTTAMRDHGLDPQRTVVVGDTVWDVEAAQRAGLPCIGLTCGGISAQELHDAAGGRLRTTRPTCWSTSTTSHPSAASWTSTTRARISVTAPRRATRAQRGRAVSMISGRASASRV